MKLHGARKLGSSSVLLNNIDKYVKKAQIFRPWKMTFRAIQANQSFWQFIGTLLGQLYAKIEKTLLNSFGANGLQMQKGPNLTFPTLKNDLRAIQPNLPFDMWFMSSQRSSMPKKEKKSFWSVSEIDPSPTLELNWWSVDVETDCRDSLLTNSMQTSWKKVSEAFLRLTPPPLLSWTDGR